MVKRILIVGGTAGIGRELAAEYAARGASVIIAGRDAARAEKAAAELSDSSAAPKVTGIRVDLSAPASIAESLSGVEALDAVVLAGMRRDSNRVKNYDIAGATELAVTKIVGYTEVIHALATRISPSGSVLLFGGAAKDAPYPGSTTVTTVNAAVTGLVSTLSRELAPIRVNAIHPGAVGDSPYWAGNAAALEHARASVLAGALPTVRDVVDGSVFLLENASVNGVNLPVDGGIR